jgi:anti-sigma regulatory factor (Ser/Thr protein kinase)
MAITPAINTVPAPSQQVLNTNYLDFTSAAANSNNWAQQYLPDLMEKEAEVFGPRTISGFLSKVGAEESMTSDQVVWSEQGRLHLSYTGKVATSTTVVLTKEIDGQAVTASVVDHGVRVNDTIIVSNANGVFKCLVTDSC